VLFFLVGVSIPPPPPPPLPLPIEPVFPPPGLDRFSIIEIIPGPIDCSDRLVVLPFLDPALDPDLDLGSLVDDPLPNPKMIWPELAGGGGTGAEATSAADVGAECGGPYAPSVNPEWGCCIVE
jgi:hypothetical protein